MNKLAKTRENKRRYARETKQKQRTKRKTKIWKDYNTQFKKALKLNKELYSQKMEGKR